MKQLLFTILNLLISNNGFTQKIIKSENISDYSMHVVGNNFEGVIFHKNYIAIPVPFEENDLSRYTPSNDDIIMSEKIIKIGSKFNGSYKINNEFIRKHLNKYLRQYLGYFNKRGEKIIMINCFWKKSVLKDEKLKKEVPQITTTNWKNQWYNVNDGGSFYWQIEINITTGKILGFGTNGVA